MLSKGLGVIFILLAVGLNPVWGLTELERASVTNPRLENAFGIPIVDNVNVNQQIQISADITNHQVKSQTFVYLVQIKNETEQIVSLGWISGQLTPDQKLNPSLSWIPAYSGEFTAEIFVWEGLKNHRALSEYTMLNISVS